MIRQIPLLLIINIKKIENTESVSQGQWLLVLYVKELFLGIVLSVSATSANIHNLKNLMAYLCPGI